MTEPRTPQIAFISGEDEYCSNATFVHLARDTERAFGFRTTRRATFPDPGSLGNLPGLDVLDEADLAVFYLRFLHIPEEQFRHIRQYIESGRPAICFRTTTHGFRYPEDHALARWNTEWPKIPGAPWITHYGHTSTTDVFIRDEAREHPLLTGVDWTFHVRSWLYEVVPDYPPENSDILLMGRSRGPGHPESEADRPANPVAWTHCHPWGGRCFTTTLGHPDDFGVEPVRRLIFNAMHWLLERPMPDETP